MLWAQASQWLLFELATAGARMHTGSISMEQPKPVGQGTRLHDDTFPPVLPWPLAMAQNLLPESRRRRAYGCPKLRPSACPIAPSTHESRAAHVVGIPLYRCSRQTGTRVPPPAAHRSSIRSRCVGEGGCPCDFGQRQEATLAYPKCWCVSVALPVGSSFRRCVRAWWCYFPIPVIQAYAS